MTRAATDGSTPVGARGVFNTTHWSVVLAATRGRDIQATEALAKLCQTYWYPLYAYVRRRGYAAADAQDLTQEFFARILERDSLVTVSPDLGKFRTFMLTALKRFLTSARRHQCAQKRGGGLELLSLDWAAAESRYDLEPATFAAPDVLFEKQWALTILNGVLRRLETEYADAGKRELFEALKQTLQGRGETQPYAALANQLSATESAVKVAVHRLRRRYRELIRAEIADTVESAEEVESELRYLFKVLAS